MHCIHSSYYGQCAIEEPCAGKPPARFCEGSHNGEIYNIKQLERTLL